MSDAKAGTGLRVLSIVGFVVMAAGIAVLAMRGRLFSSAPLVIGIQVLAVALLLWARVTFGGRSFHAAANPTAGGLVTSGPYRFIRHPIYTAACLFTWAGVAVHLSVGSLALAAVATAGALMRMLTEERLLIERYPEYADYARSTKRMIPFVF